MVGSVVGPGRGQKARPDLVPSLVRTQTEEAGQWGCSGGRSGGLASQEEEDRGDLQAVRGAVSSVVGVVRGVKQASVSIECTGTRCSTSRPATRASNFGPPLTRARSARFALDDLHVRRSRPLPRHGGAAGSSRVLPRLYASVADRQRPPHSTLVRSLPTSWLVSVASGGLQRRQRRLGRRQGPSADKQRADADPA